MTHKTLGLVAAVCLATGCSTTVVLKTQPLPSALVEPYPLDAAVRYTETINQYAHQETLPTGEKFSIDLGSASRQMFDTTLGDMFTSVAVVAPGERPPEGVDLTLEPSIEALEFALPSQTVTKDYAVWIKYRIKVYDSNGNLQANYPMSAYGKSSDESLLTSNEAALESAASRALRDAAVLLLTRFEKEASLAKTQLAGMDLNTTPVADENLPGSLNEGPKSAPALPPTDDTARTGEQFL